MLCLCTHSLLTVHGFCFKCEPRPDCGIVGSFQLQSWHFWKGRWRVNQHFAFDSYRFPGTQVSCGAPVQAALLSCQLCAGTALRHEARCQSPVRCVLFCRCLTAPAEFQDVLVVVAEFLKQRASSAKPDDAPCPPRLFAVDSLVESPLADALVPKGAQRLSEGSKRGRWRDFTEC